MFVQIFIIQFSEENRNYNLLLNLSYYSERSVMEEPRISGSLFYNCFSGGSLWAEGGTSYNNNYYTLSYIIEILISFVK